MKLKILLLFLFLFLPGSLEAQKTLELKNADFARLNSDTGHPADWRLDDLIQAARIPGGIQLTLVKNHVNHSSLTQNIPVADPSADLLLSGTVASELPRSAYLQVKFFRNKKELRRVSSASNGKGPTDVQIRFSPGEADSIQILCRLAADRPLGTTAVFSNLRLGPVPPGKMMEWETQSGNVHLDFEKDDSGSVTGFRANLLRSQGERFASVGEDFLLTQSVPLPKNPDGFMEFAAELQAEFVQFGWMSLELFQNGKRVDSFHSPRNRWCRDTFRIVFDPMDADRAVLHFHFDGRQKFHGEKVKFSNIYFGPERLDFIPSKPPETTLEIVPGFETASVYLQNCRADSAEGCRAKLAFRLASDDQWQEALSPVYLSDERSLRGSIVHLKEGTEYEIRLTVNDDGNEKRLTSRFKTLSSNVRIRETIELSEENCPIPFIPPKTGSEEEGFVRYVPKPGFILDAGTKADCAVRFHDSQFIIFDGFTVRGGRRNGIELENSKNIRILNCDIAGYGRVGEHRPDLDGKFYENGKALNNDCGIRIISSETILVERCFIHDPRGTSNSWFYSHPSGPNAVFVGDTAGLCLRWNDFIGSDLHRWNDSVEGQGNGSNSGSVRRDAEISGNYFAFGNDDGMELDGGQINCRFFFNLTEGHLCGVSTAPCRRGPSYLWQNLFCAAGDEFGFVGVGFKNNYQNLGAAPTFFIANTILTHSVSFSSPGGTREEYLALAPTRPFKAFARNNLSQNASAASKSFFDNLRSDFDWNLYSPQCEKELEWLRSIGQEKNSILADALFTEPKSGNFALDADSPGKAAGTFVPNFIPLEKPDLGAIVPGTKIDVLPFRPIPFRTSVSRVELTENQNSARKVILTAEKDSPFRIVQPDAAAFFRVTPSSGIIRPGKPLVLTVEPVQEAVTDARLNRGAFLVRAPDGFSRPVSVTLDSRGNAKLKEKVRKDALYAKIRALENGASELEFNVPRDGKYWLFARGTAEGSRWRWLQLDGGEKEERVSLAPREAGEIWRNVGTRTYGGAPNRPFSLNAGRHIFILSPQNAKPLKITNAALCENPDAFRLAP